MTFDHDYQRLLLDLLSSGDTRPTRAKLASTGQPVGARTLFGRSLSVSLQHSFPLLTLRRMSIRVVAAELLWFLSGSTNAADLRALGSTIWDEWQREDGSLGPVYGAQWRAFHGRDGRVVDQVSRLVDNLRAVKKDPAHPAARRLLLTSYNPADAETAALPPCHVMAQWDVGGWRDGLSCILTQRSADAYLGLPYNVASYALLTHLLAGAVGLTPGTLTVNMGNVHLYDNHVEQARTLLGREPMRPPDLRIQGVSADGLGMTEPRWEDGRFMLHVAPGYGVKRTPIPLLPEHITVDDYEHHPALPGEVAV